MSRPRTLLEFLRSVPVVSRIPMRWGDMDAFQHLNNCVYFRYQEAARIKFFNRLISTIKEQDPNNKSGFNGESFNNATGLGPILASTNCRYLFPATFPDTLLMGAKIINQSSDQFTLQHTSWSLRHGRVVSEGEGKIVTFDYLKGERCELHPAMIPAMEAIEATTSENLSSELELFINRGDFEA